MACKDCAPNHRGVLINEHAYLSSQILGLTEQVQRTRSVAQTMSKASQAARDALPGLEAKLQADLNRQAALRQRLDSESWDAMTLEEKYNLAIATLQKISNFRHVEDCHSSAPVHECGCYDKDERELAQDCLEKLDE